MLDFVKSLCQVINYVINMLDAYWQTYRTGVDILVGELFGRQLRVSCRRGVDYQWFNIGNVGEEWEYLQAVDKAISFLLSAIDFEGEDRTAAIGEVFFYIAHDPGESARRGGWPS